MFNLLLMFFHLCSCLCVFVFSVKYPQMQTIVDD